MDELLTCHQVVASCGLQGYNARIFSARLRELAKSGQVRAIYEDVPGYNGGKQHIFSRLELVADMQALEKEGVWLAGLSGAMVADRLASSKGEATEVSQASPDTIFVEGRAAMKIAAINALVGLSRMNNWIYWLCREAGLPKISHKGSTYIDLDVLATAIAGTPRLESRAKTIREHMAIIRKEQGSTAVPGDNAEETLSTGDVARACGITDGKAVKSVRDALGSYVRAGKIRRHAAEDGHPRGLTHFFKTGELVEDLLRLAHPSRRLCGMPLDAVAQCVLSGGTKQPHANKKPAGSAQPIKPVMNEAPAQPEPIRPSLTPTPKPSGIISGYPVGVIVQKLSNLKFSTLDVENAIKRGELRVRQVIAEEDYKEYLDHLLRLAQ